MSERAGRVVIVFDGEKWHVRRLATSVRDLERDEMVYQCDQPIANDLQSGRAALKAAYDFIDFGRTTP